MQHEALAILTQNPTKGDPTLWVCMISIIGDAARDSGIRASIVEAFPKFFSKTDVQHFESHAFRQSFGADKEIGTQSVGSTLIASLIACIKAGEQTGKYITS